MSDASLEKVLEVLNGLKTEIQEIRQSADRALSEVDDVRRKTSRSKPPSNPGDSPDSNTGLSLKDALELIEKTEHRATANMTTFMQLHTDALRAQSKAFLDGLNQGMLIHTQVREEIKEDQDDDDEDDGIGSVGISDVIDAFQSLKQNGKAGQPQFSMQAPMAAPLPAPAQPKPDDSRGWASIYNGRKEDGE